VRRVCEDAGVETRGRFIIDPDEVIQGYEVLTPPVGRNVSETFRQVQAFQIVRESKGTEARPSGWKPGQKTLKPGPGLVGRASPALNQRAGLAGIRLTKDVLSDHQRQKQ